MKQCVIYLGVVIIPALICGLVIMPWIMNFLGVHVDAKIAFVLGAALYLIIIRFRGWQRW
jgi:sorbitol-specific phosphotransferase system component IIC